ncbi:hypothetical protein LIER_25153 [Lithospermum erythrorhizon]|uniref:Uncharacterized protein n=1 Tax=Lithospermum erythrorhizon TaxID=34254 RepID=A0AAV3R7Q2_LITER
MVQAKVIVATGAHVILDSDVSTLEDPKSLKTGGTVVLVELGQEKMANVDLINLFLHNAIMVCFMTGGTVVLVELGPEKMANVDLRNLFGRNGVLHVVNRMWWTPEYMAEVVREMRGKMWPEFTSGKLVLPEDSQSKMYRLSEVADARIGDLITPI